ncbi:uncharacterized protein LOC128390622 [Panonychus citri]|uniref:uncharacterized protein LOC128390622 n=1 Tax=Panonychus citri TaxID=50023 RepID=UPI0023076AFA|nr:uncharacterized protein LOC128390622 [Panonychus citri]
MQSMIIFAVLFSVAYGSYIHAPAAAIVTGVAQAPVSIPTVVKTGITQHAFNVPESRFTRSDWSTPGATYAIPAVAQYTVTRPGYTTYQEGPSIVRNGYVPTSVPVATITKHQALTAIPAAPYAYAPFAAHGYAAPYATAW